MHNKIILIAFFSVVSLFLKAQAHINNFYEHYTHRAILSDFYIKRYLPMKDICYADICNYDLVSRAQAESIIESNTYYLLTTLIYNKQLDSDFYLLMTYDKITSRYLDKLFIRKNTKDLANPNKTVYETVNLVLNEKYPSKFSLEYVSEKNISSILFPSSLPKIQIKTIKSNKYNIFLTGKFSKVIESQTSIDSDIQKDKYGKIDVQKLKLFKNEILARYNYDFGDKKTNDFFIKNTKGTYRPEQKEIEKITLSEIDKQTITLIDEKIAEVADQAKLDALKTPRGGEIIEVKTPALEKTKSVESKLPSSATKQQKINPKIDSVKRQQLKSLENKPKSKIIEGKTYMNVK